MQNEPIDLRKTNLPRVGEYLESLPVPVTDQEWAIQASMAAELGGRIESIQAAAKLAQTEARSEIKMLQTARRVASKIVRDRAEDLPVSVSVFADLSAGLAGVALFVRMDTKQVVKRRALTAEEADSARQDPLPFRG
jgi:hypothetical protein